MDQQRFWSKNRKWEKAIRRPRKIELSARGIYEPVELEEDVLQTTYSLLWFSGIPVFRERERIPKVSVTCEDCGRKWMQWVGRPSEAGHPDLHGWVPFKKLPPMYRASTPNGSAVPFYIEMKRPKGGIHSEEQKQFILKALRDGVVAFFAHSWSDVRREFGNRFGITLPEG
jgi:hypothetical protein